MHKDARLVKSAFATLDFPLSYHTDRDSEFGNMAIDELLNVFDYKTHALQEGPHDNAIDETTNKILKAEFIYRERSSTLRKLQVKLSERPPGAAISDRIRL